MIRKLLPNDELSLRGQSTARWQVIDPRPRCGRIKLFDCESHQEHYKEFSEVNDAIISGELFVRRENAPKFSAAAQNDPELDKQIQRAHRALREVEAVQKKYGLSLSKAYDRVLEQQGSEGRAEFASRPTLYRYAKARRSGLPPLRGDKCKGNRTARYADKVVELICDTANSLFLKEGSRWTLRNLTDRVNSIAKEFGWIARPARISRSFVRKTIFENLTVDPEIDRMDPRLVSGAKSIAKNRIVVSSPLERIEQDGLHVPFVVRTPHGPAGNIWLVHAIDCATGAPAGWNLRIGSPTVADSLRCVESILFPKTSQLKALGLACDLNVFGTPHLLVFDNGPENRAGRMHNLVRLDIDVMHCRSHDAKGKPFIERLNRALKEALQTLPGCTRMNGKDGTRDPIALGDELMELHELERWIVRWYFEDWANRPLKRHLRSDFSELGRLGQTPAERWKRMTGELAFAVPISPSMAEWRMTLYDHEPRKLSRKTGITYKAFNYKGDNLAYLIERYGETEVKVLVNPDDFRQVFVDDGEGMPLVPLTEEFVDSTTPAYSFKDAEEKYRSPAGPVPGEDIRKKFQEDVQARSLDSPGTRARKKSKAERNREVADKTRADQAVHRAVKNPLTPSAAPKAPPTSPAPSSNESFDGIAPLTVRSRTTGETPR